MAKKRYITQAFICFKIQTKANFMEHVIRDYVMIQYRHYCHYNERMKVFCSRKLLMKDNANNLLLK